jgi:predicted Holliday junction resolvase-like endonuclease
MLPIAKYIEEFTTGIVTTLVLGVIWLFRTVFTNQKEIAMLKEDIRYREERLNEEIKNRERVRGEDRTILLAMKDELKADMRETQHKVESLQSDISELWKSR